MATYYAITRHGGQWRFICAGSDPDDVMHRAMTVLELQGGVDDEAFVLSPAIEQQLNALRVVPDVTAKEKYNVYPTAIAAEEYE